MGGFKGESTLDMVFKVEGRMARHVTRDESTEEADPVQAQEGVAESGEATGDADPGEGLSMAGRIMLRAARLIGKTAGLAQEAGVHRAVDVAKAAENVHWSLFSFRAKRATKRMQAERRSRIAYLERSVVDLYGRIGARACEVARADPPVLSEDPRLLALVSTAVARRKELRELSLEPSAEETCGTTVQIE